MSTVHEAAPRAILLVEDNPGDADLIQEMLAEAPRMPASRIIHVANLSDAATVLAASSIEAVLLDLQLPDGCGVECVRSVRQRAQSVPIVVLTGCDDEELAMSCIAAGAQDYLPKIEVQSRMLSRAIDYAVVRMREARERRRAEEANLRSAELERENERIVEANRVKSVFLAAMSHELRTPLNAIIGFSELIVDHRGELDSDSHDNFVRRILDSGRHLLHLIDDVLDLAKVEAGKMEFRPVVTPLEPLVRDIVEVVHGSFKDKRVDVQVDVDGGLVEARIDPGRFRQVLYNYLSNAFKVTPERGAIVVRVAALDADWFRVDVEDQGPGISPEDMDRLFVDFLQLRSVQGQLQSGTGLGLALTRRLVEAQGGTVAVRSRVGSGSTFSATLCRVMPQEGAE